jgi:peptidoglycan-N-acetylglucosamine deacetylase
VKGEVIGRDFHQDVHILRAIIITLGVLFGLLLFYQPRWALRRLGRDSGRILWFVETDSSLIALTIDDGPDPSGTPAILDVLARHGARATFFLLTSNIAGREQLVLRLLADGHEIGNHMIRDEPSFRLDAREFERQFLGADAVLKPFVSTRPDQPHGERVLATRWFRPVSGYTNRPMIDSIMQHGAVCVLGSIYPYDPFIPWPRYAAWQIRANARAGEIIILHDGPRRGLRTADALDRVLPVLVRKGFRAVSLSELWSASSNS